MDQQVAPVPAAGHPAVRRLAPAVGEEHGRDDQADGGGDQPGGAVVAERVAVAGQ